MKYVVFVLALLVCIVGVSAVDYGNTGAAQAVAVTAETCKGDSLTWTGSECRVKPTLIDEKLNCYNAGGVWTPLTTATASEPSKYYCKDPDVTAFTRAQDEDTITIERSTVVGLENALIRVKYNQSRTVIEANIAKLAAMDLEKLQKLENATLEKDNGDTVVKGVGKARFLGIIPYMKSYNYQVTADGTLSQKRGVFDFLSTTG